MLISANLTDKSLKAFARFAKVSSMANCARVGRFKTRSCTTNHIVLLIVCSLILTVKLENHLDEIVIDISYNSIEIDIPL